MGTYLRRNDPILNDTILNDTIMNDTILNDNIMNDSFLSFNCHDDLVTIQVLLIIIICFFTCFILLLFCAKIEDCYYRIKYNCKRDREKRDREKRDRENEDSKHTQNNNINLPQLPQPPHGDIFV